jgi:hypothetical protein
MDVGRPCGRPFFFALKMVARWCNYRLWWLDLPAPFLQTRTRFVKIKKHAREISHEKRSDVDL